MDSTIERVFYPIRPFFMHSKIEKIEKLSICDLSWKIEFLGYDSGQGVKNLDFFSIFRIYKFWSILTTFDLVLSRKREVSIKKIVKYHESGPYV